MDSFLIQINIHAESLVNYLINSSIHFCVLFILIFTASLILRKESASFLYILWNITFLSLFLPPIVRFLQNITRQDINFTGNIPILTIPTITIQSNNDVTFYYHTYFAFIWLFFVVTIFIFWSVQNRKFNKSLTNCYQVTDKQCSIISKYPVPVLTCADIDTPFTKGIFTPAIYLPENMLLMPEKEIEAIIAHEYAHIKRRDTMLIALQNIIQIVHFFNPLIWLANIKIAELREKACDDLAIHHSKENSLDYSKHLLNTLDRHSRNWQPFPLMINSFHRSNKLILNRFKYLLNRRENNMVKISVIQKVVIFSFLIVAFVIACNENKSELNVTETKSLQKTDVEFVKFKTSPQPIDGFISIQKNLEYPETARKAGIEGIVMVQTSINAQGKVEEVKVTESMGDKACEEAAMKAIKSVKWEPALDDEDKPVKVWITIPITFKLKGEVDKLTKPPYFYKNTDTYIPFDTPPQPVGDFKAIQAKLVYPEAARKAGIEGKVILHVQIDENGNVLKTKVLESLGHGCDDAAVSAVKQVKWKPAVQKNKPVKVWVALPVVFKLDKEKKD